MLGDEAVQTGSSWLLKHHIERGGQPIDRRMADSLYRRAQHLSSWQAKLHILQCLEHVPVSRTMAPAVACFLRAWMQDEVKFVRASAYSGLHELAVQQAEFRSQASAIPTGALTHETAASVRSRLRRQIKLGLCDAASAARRSWRLPLRTIIDRARTRYRH